MNTEQWNQVKALFEAAQSVALAERATFLEARCADPAVREEVL